MGAHSLCIIPSVPSSEQSLLLAGRHTQIPQEVLDDYINELSQVFTPEAYNLFTNNCNNFSNELATFLTGQPIPVGKFAPIAAQQ